MSLKDNLRVMVVDDMSVSRALISQSLEEIGIRHVATEADGRAALGKLAANPVHLVISDYNMPGMDGLQLLQSLRGNARTKGVGFILITGRADAGLIDLGRRFGMNNFLKKPFTPQDLRACIEAVVGRL